MFIIINSNYGSNIKISGNNDNITFNNVMNNTQVYGGGYGCIGTGELTINNTTKYKYYKLEISDSWSSSLYCTIKFFTNEINYYCYKTSNGYFNIINDFSKFKIPSTNIYKIVKLYKK